MNEFLVFRAPKETGDAFELAGSFESLKDAQEYAKNCASWGFEVKIYEAL